MSKGASDSIKVVCRFRGGQASNELWDLLDDGKSCIAPQVKVGQGIKNKFAYDAILDSDVGQEEMYAISSRDNVIGFMEGYNGTIFAYGQSGSGKTFCMLGPDEVTQEIVKGSQNVPDEIQRLYGIIPRAMADIFMEINRIQDQENAKFKIKANYYEIYNEKFNDITLGKAGENLKIMEVPHQGIIVKGDQPHYVTSPEDFFKVI